MGSGHCRRETFGISMRVFRKVLIDKMTADLWCQVGEGMSHKDTGEESSSDCRKSKYQGWELGAGSPCPRTSNRVVMNKVA